MSWLFNDGRVRSNRVFKKATHMRFQICVTVAMKEEWTCCRVGDFLFRVGCSLVFDRLDQCGEA